MNPGEASAAGRKIYLLKVWSRPTLFGAVIVSMRTVICEER